MVVPAAGEASDGAPALPELRANFSNEAAS